METVVKGDQVANSSQMEVTGDYDWLNGYYNCSAGDGVHKTQGALLTSEMHLYDTANYLTTGSDYGQVDAGDFWWMSTYVQCNTTTKVAQIRVTLTYPQDASVRNHDMLSGYFYRDGKQYSLDFPGEHDFQDDHASFEPVWNQDAAWER
jgi:hypothetical protein